ncbi:hypothetical protein ACFQL7_20800 [Halocatena marina]|uniref:Ig-like domain-containing protein n=1 Tax=Halocatena marina TaxID=2934937 RepID=A0ABD5YRD2_9EURY|nr:hypothetical protein [Halocatena marina]
MPIQVNPGSGNTHDVYYKSGGSWSKADSLYVKRNGSWDKVWPAYLEIDYFGDSDLAEYTQDFSGTASIQTGNHGPSPNTERLVLDQQKRLISNPGDGLPNYPAFGQQWEFYFRPMNFYNTPAFLRCNFMGMGSYGTDRTYRLEWESDPTSGSDWSFEKRDGGSVVLSQATGDGLGVDTGTTYRCLIDMTDTSSSPTINVEWWNYSTNTQLRTLSLTDNEASGKINGSAIAFETNGYMKAGFDTARILP